MTARKIKVKWIMELHSHGCSRNSIAESCRMSRHSVSDVINIAKDKGISFQDIQSLSDEEVYKLFFPERHTAEDIYLDPDYKYIHKELSRNGVTLRLLHDEYKDKACREGAIPMGYTRFCEGYRVFIDARDVANRLDHKPGRHCEVDWSGPTISFYDGYGPNGEDGPRVTAYLFVGCLPFSRYAYVEPALDMKMDSFIMAHVHMFEYFHGVPAILICDNLKTGVVKHPKEGEIIFTGEYQALAYHYMTAIMPARVRKPKDKPSVENTVGNIATAIIAKLRNTKSHSFQELKQNVSRALNSYNAKDFEKREGSRTQVFENEERKYLRPLPAIRYEKATIVKDRKVYPNYHVSFKKNFYSVPYTLVHKKVDLKITENAVEIYSNGERVATHARFPEYLTNKYSTVKEHMPPSFRHYSEWDDARLKNWASAIGPDTRRAVDRLFDAYPVKEQAYNGALALLNLSRKFGDKRLETACGMSLKKGIQSPRYRHLNAILSANQDLYYLETQKSRAAQQDAGKGFLRGSGYYKKSESSQGHQPENNPEDQKENPSVIQSTDSPANADAGEGESGNDQ